MTSAAWVSAGSPYVVVKSALAFRLHPDELWPHEVGVLSPSLVALEDDPAAGHPDAEPVGEESELAAIPRQETALHAERFLEVYGPTTRFGRRALWAAVTDALDGACSRAAKALGDEAAAVSSAGLLLNGERPFTSESTIRRFTDLTGRCWWTRRRQSCCYAYKLPDTETCFTCPRTTDAQRRAAAAASPDGAIGA